MTTTVQRVRELQEQIRASEAKLLELTQQPEYLAEQQFIQDVSDVLEMHGRTLREAVLALDPNLLGSMPDRQQKPKRPYKARKSVDLEAFKLAPEPKPEPAPKVSPFASFGQSASAEVPAPVVNGADHPLEPEPKKPAKKQKRASGNAKRNAERRVDMIKGGRWFLYTNPHTGEKHEAAGQRDDLLRGWAAEFGKSVVESWKRPITPAEAGIE